MAQNPPRFVVEMSSNSSDDEPPRKRKRGVTNEVNYRRNVIRQARVKGEEYKNYKGNMVPRRSVPDEILCHCPGKCSLSIDDETKNKIWNYFYGLETKNMQDTYLQTLIEVKEVKRRVKTNKGDVGANETSRSLKRNKTFKYKLRIKGVLTPVCKNVFLQIHGISRDRVARLTNLLVQNKTPIDMRGKNRSGNAIADNVCVLVHDHISQFEVKETHYGGKPKHYLDARLNISKMYDLFLTKHQEMKDKVKYNFYYKYFKENFNYSFGRPQVDVCSQCESFSAKLRDPCLSDNVKRSVTAEQMIHKRRAKKFYSKLKEMSENKDKDTVALCFDFMQNLPLPNIPVQEVFYMRQLWLYVFGIHDLKTNKTHIYLYHEGEANKSPDEVCSLLLHYLNETVSSEVKHLVLFSDGPSSQNKNHTVVRFLMNLCDRGVFETVTHYFPVRGHSFLPCDRDFGSIKRVLRKVDRVYTPDQYAELILKASTTERFSVHQITSKDIFNFKNWWPQFYKKNVNSDETLRRAVPKDKKVPFKVSSYKQFEFNTANKGKVTVQQFIDGFMSSTFTLKKYKNVPDLPTVRAYPSGKVPINKKKLEDLVKLSAYTTGYEDFYNDILQWPTTEAMCNVDREYDDE